MKFRQSRKVMQWAAAALGIGFSAITIAGGIETPTEVAGPYFSMFGGVNWEYSGTTSAVNFGGLATNLYVPNNDNSTTGPVVGADVGYAWALAERTMFLALGVESSYTRVISPYGRVRPLFFVNPNFDTLNYNYAITSVPLFGTFKFGGIIAGFFEPYVLAGVGVSWNRAFNYNEVPTDPLATASPMRSMFQPNSETEFAYTFGGGFGFQVTRSTNLALEYRYTNYGNASLNSSLYQETTQGLSLGEIHSNALLARMTVFWAL